MPLKPAVLDQECEQGAILVQAAQRSTEVLAAELPGGSFGEFLARLEQNPLPTALDLLQINLVGVLSELLATSFDAGEESVFAQGRAVALVLDDVPPDGLAGVQLTGCCTNGTVPIQYTVVECFLDVDGAPCFQNFERITDVTLVARPPSGLAQLLDERSAPEDDWNPLEADVDGVWGFFTIMTDQSGNVEDAPSGPLTVNGAFVDDWILIDRVSPSSAAAVTAEYFSSAATILPSALDTAGAGAVPSGIKRIEVFVREPGQTEMPDTPALIVPVSSCGRDEVGGAAAVHDLPITVPLTTEGAHDISTVAVDCAGNRESLADEPDASFIYDITPPVITFTPARVPDCAGWYTAPVDVEVTATDGVAGQVSGVDTLEYELNGGSLLALESPLTVADDGSHAITARATDRVGNIRNTGTTIGLDAVSPTLTAGLLPSGPDGTGGWYRNAPTLSLSGSDATSGGLVLDYRIGDGDFAAYAPPVELTGQGAQAVTGRATDAACHATTAALSFQLDSVPPTVTPLVEPTEPDGLAGWYVTAAEVKATMSDATSGPLPDSIEVSVNGAEPSPLDDALVLDEDGVFDVVLQGLDAAGTSGQAPLRFLIDRTPPVLEASTAPAEPDQAEPWFGNAVIVTLDALDFTSGIDASTLEARVDGGDWEPYEDGVLVGGSGEHVVDFRGRDIAGNLATLEFPVFVDLEAPTVELLLEPPVPDGLAGWYISPVLVSAVAADDASGVDSVTLRHNGEDVEGESVVANADGEHVVDAIVRDRAGRVSGASVLFSIDSTPPAIEVLEPSDGETLTHRSVLARFAVTEPHLTELTCALDEEPAVPCDGADWHDLLQLERGSHVFAIYARDEGGLEATLVTTFTVDPPTGTLSADAPADTSAEAPADAPSAPAAETAPAPEAPPAPAPKDAGIQAGAEAQAPVQGSEGSTVETTGLLGGDLDMSIVLGTDCTGCQLQVTTHAEPPPSAPPAPSGITPVLTMEFNVVASDGAPVSAAVARATLRVAIARANLPDSSAPSQVVVVRLSPPFVVLETRIVSAPGADPIVYEALLPSFSVFAISIDSTPPRLTARLEPTLDLGVIGRGPTLVATAEDVGPVRVEARVCAPGCGAFEPVAATGMPIDALGAVRVEVRATDSAGNVAMQVLPGFLVDAQAPVPRMTIESAASGLFLDGSESSDNYGIRRYRWSVPEVGDVVGRRAFLGLPGPGQYTVTLEVTDIAGNTARLEETVTVTEDELLQPAGAREDLLTPTARVLAAAATPLETGLDFDQGVTVRLSASVEGAQQVRAFLLPVGGGDAIVVPVTLSDEGEVRGQVVVREPGRYQAVFELRDASGALLLRHEDGIVELDDTQEALVPLPVILPLLAFLIGARLRRRR